MNISSIFAGAMVVLSLASCSGNESGKEPLIKDYEKACETGNIVEAATVLNKLSTNFSESDFTEADLDRFDKAYDVLDSIVGYSFDEMDNLLDRWFDNY